MENSFFEKINNITKPLTRLMRRKRKEDMNFQYWDGTWDIMTDPTDIKRIIKEYYELLFIYKSDNLDEMYQFLEKHKLSPLISMK
jgi:hypothetical protein